MTCKYCQTEFEGDICPGCGASASNQNLNKDIKSKVKKSILKRWWLYAALVAALIVVSGNLGQNGTGTKVPEAGKAASSSQPGVKEDISSVPTEYTLSAGHYVTGVDIPVGKCNVTAVSGSGNLSSSNMYSGGINEMFGVDEKMGYAASFSGLKLPKKTTLSASGKLVFKLVYTDIEKGITGRTYDESKAVTLSDGNYEAGTDFNPGTYKIVAVSGKGNLSSSNMYGGGLNEMFGVDDGTGFYTSEFVNASFDNGVTLSLNGGMQIKLIPESK